MALKTLKVKFGVDTRDYERGLKRVSSGLSSLVKTGLGLAGIGLGLKGLVDSTKAFVGLESSVMRVHSLFGEASKYITYFAENTAKGFGMAESSAYQYAAVYGNLFRGITDSAEENSKVTIAMLKASSVVASQTGRTMEDVMERIRSGLLGNTEAIEDLGINVNVAMLETTDAFKRMADGRSWAKLTFHEQQQIRTLAILEQAHASFGTEVQQGSAFSLSVLSGVFKDLLSTAGMFVNAGLQPIIAGLIQVVQWATAGLKALAAFFGLQVNTGAGAAGSIAGQTAAQEELTDEVKETGKAAKQTAAGFDVFNDISQAQGAGSSEGPAAALGADSSPFAGIEMPEFEVVESETSWIERLASRFDALKASEPFTAIGDAFHRAWDGLTPVVDGFQQRFGALWEDLRTLADPFTEWLQTGLPRIIVGLVDYWGLVAAGAGDSLLKVWDTAQSALFPIFEWMVTDGLPLVTDFYVGYLDIMTALFGRVKGIFDTIWSAAVDPTMKLISKVIVDTLTTIKNFWDRWGDRIVASIVEMHDNMLRIFQSLWSEILEPIVGHALEMLAGLWDNHIRGMIEALLDFVAIVITATYDIFNEFIAPIIEWLTVTLGPTFRTVFGVIIDVIGATVGVIVDVATTIIKVLGGIVEFIAGVFTGDWQRAWDGITAIFGAVWEGAKKGFVGFINFIVRGINTMIKGILSPINALISGWNMTVGRVTGQIPTITIAIPEIPALAKGGLAYGAITALVGDNFNARQDPEVIAPLSTLKGMILEALMQKEIATGGGKEIRVILQLENGEVLADLLIDPLNDKAKNLGYAPVFRPAT